MIAMHNIKDLFKSVLSNDRILTDDNEVMPYSRDKSYFNSVRPLAVLKPKDSKELSEIMKIANENKIKVIARSGGTSLTGASIVNTDAVVISLELMNRIRIYKDDQIAIVQPAVKIDELNRELARYNLFFPVDPASSYISEIGGNLSTNAAGLLSVRYGPISRWVLGLEVVLPDGSIIRTGTSTIKQSLGFDLTHLFIGSEGILGIITEAKLQVISKPKDAVSVVISYDSIKDLIEDVKIARVELDILKLEFLDNLSAKILSKELNDMQIKPGFILNIEAFDSASKIESLFKDKDIKILKDDEKQKFLFSRKRLHDYLESIVSKEGKDMLVEDIAIPLSNLYEAYIEIEELLKKEEHYIFGHIGEGNLHINLFIDKGDIRHYEDLTYKLGELTLRHNGTISAEHGIGLEKKELLKLHYKYLNSEHSLELIKSIKRLIDPNNILNPGKVIDL